MRRLNKTPPGKLQYNLKTPRLVTLINPFWEVITIISIFSLVVLIFDFFKKFDLSVHTINFQLSQLQISKTNILFLHLMIVVFFFYLSFLLNIVIHEVGHFFVGSFFKLNVYYFKVGAFKVYKINNKWNLSFKIKDIFSHPIGRCAFFATTKERLGSRFLYAILGGPLFSALGVICAIYLESILLPGFGSTFALIFLFIGICFLISNIFPTIFNNSKSDGYQICEFMLNKINEEDLWLSIQLQRFICETGRLPLTKNDDIIKNFSHSNSNYLNFYSHYCSVLNYDHIEKNLEKLEDKLSYLFENEDHYDIPQREWIRWVIANFFIYYKPNPTAALAWFNSFESIQPIYEPYKMRLQALIFEQKGDYSDAEIELQRSIDLYQKIYPEYQDETFVEEAKNKIRQIRKEHNIKI